MVCFFFIFFVVPSTFLSQVVHTKWDEIVVGGKQRVTTLECIHQEVRAAVKISWMVQRFGADDWKLVLTASDLEEFSGSGAKPSMHLADPNFQNTGNFSLLLQPLLQDSGYYKCFVEQNGKKIKQKVILLAIATVFSIPASPIPRKSTLRLIAKIHPEVICDKILWESPDGTSLKTVLKPKSGFMTKVPQATDNDAGSYKCTVHLLGKHNTTTFTFALRIKVNAVSEAIFTTIEHGPPIFIPIQAGRSVSLACPEIRGDYVFLYWQHPKTGNLKLLYSRDDWRVKTWIDSESHDFKLTSTPSTLYGTSYTFALKPGLKDGGVYICQVLSNDSLFNQRTLLTVLKVMGVRFGSNLQLECLYNELGRVQFAKWEYQNKSRLLQSSIWPGNVTTTLPLPITPDMEGNYTCTLHLQDGRTISARHAVKKQVIVPVPSSTFHFLLLTLLLLVLLVAATTTAVLLWRQKRISRRGIEQSLSVHSGEMENIYENPEDVRQALPQGSFYMDLKPRHDDVYKELDR
ncbi:g6f-like [Stigmatopora argus]